MNKPNIASTICESCENDDHSFHISGGQCAVQIGRHQKCTCGGRMLSWDDRKDEER